MFHGRFTPLAFTLATATTMLALALVPPRAHAATDPETTLEQAARCLRRGDLPCAEREAKALLALPTPPPELAREAAAIELAAIARGDTGARGPDAVAACTRLLAIWPGYTPPPDADPRVASACDTARRQALEARLPPALEPGPAPLPELAPLLPAPLVYAPARLATLPDSGPALSLSLGAGVGLPIGAAADRVDPGIHAAIDLRLELDARWAVWVQATLALMKLATELPLEPHEGTSLTAFSASVGAELRLPLARDLELSLALGLGLGGFGLRGADEAMGLAVSPSAGVRYRLDANLAARLDLAPVLVIPDARDVGPGGHLAIVLRGEATF